MLQSTEKEPIFAYQATRLTMTIPDKPTSPKQQYLTTLKGRLALEFLKRHAK